jgi:hypothetical protein
MKMSKRKILTISIIGALVVAVAFGAVAYGSARAAGIISNVEEVAAGVQERGGREIIGVSDEDLAEALGITVDELTAVREEAKEAAVEQAVADGLITQVQADEILSGDRPALLRGHWSNWLSENGIDYQAYLAEALGITVEELQAARVEAFTANITQAVADGTVTQEKADLILGRFTLAQDSTFQSDMQAAFEAAVSAAVERGVITQAQADQLLANQSDLWMGGIGGNLRGHRGGPFDAPETTTP